MREGLDLLREMNLRFCAPFNGTLLAELEARAGRVDDGLATLDLQFAAAETTGERWFLAEMHRVRGSLLQLRPAASVAESEAAYLRAVEIAKAQHARTFELRATLSLSALYRSTGREQEARTMIAQTLAKFPRLPPLPEVAEAQRRSRAGRRTRGASRVARGSAADR
jgi:predicted ATPase